MTRFLRAAARPVLMLLVLAGLGWALRRLGLDGLVLRAGEGGPAVFALVAGLACFAGLPRQMVSYAAGLLYGFWPAVLLALAAELAGCAANFALARVLGRHRAARWLAAGGPDGRVARLERHLVAHAFTATLTLRLLPVGNNLALNVLAGVSRVAPAPFLLASAIGYVPQTVIFTLLGEGVRVSEALQLLLAGVLLLVSVAGGLLLLRRRPAIA